MYDDRRPFDGEDRVVEIDRAPPMAPPMAPPLAPPLEAGGGMAPGERERLLDEIYGLRNDNLQLKENAQRWVEGEERN